MVLASLVISLKIIIFHGDDILLIIFDMRDTKIKMTQSCLPPRVGSKLYFLALEGQFQNLASGQVRAGRG